MKMSDFKLNVIRKDTQTLLQTYRMPLFFVSILMAFLLFIMNVFLAGSLYGQQFNDAMKSKLGVYIYLTDSIGTSKEQIPIIKSDLEKAGLKVNYTSKQDALAFVEKRVSDLTKTLQKYNLENPIPSTLYIRYQNAEEFAAMKAVLEEHKAHILNMNDLSDNAIKTQEKRVLNIINLSNFIQSFGYMIVGVMVTSVIVFAVFFLQAMFAHFRKDIQAKKLLGASKSQIAQPFLRVILRTLAMAFIIAFLLIGVLSIPLEEYLGAVFAFSLWNHVAEIIFDILAIGIGEIIVIMGLLMGVSYRYVLRLHKSLK